MVRGMSKELIFTIGHSNYTLSYFIDLLRGAKVNAIADVRSIPYSRANPHFNREDIKEALRRDGIAYVFLGLELGARSSNPTAYVNGRVQYAKLALTPQFEAGLQRLRKGAASHRIALMCAEKEPLDCHRTLLVTRHLVQSGVEVQHILSSGAIESHSKTEDRLIKMSTGATTDLFRSRRELLEDAYRRQEAKIAFTDNEPPNLTGEEQ